MDYSKLLDISIEKYHEHHAISRSGVMLFKKSPLHYWNRYFNAAKEDEKSAELILGNAFHALVLEPILFEEKYCVAPKVDRRTTLGKQQYAKFENENFGKILLTKDQSDQINKMAESVWKSEYANQLIKQGVYEKSAFWVDETTNVACKCRPDIITSDMVCDIKTSSDASYSSFQRDLYNYGYHIQAAMISDGLLVACNIQINDFIFIVIEKEPPYAVAIYRLNEESISQGRKEYKEILVSYNDCLAKDNWPSYQMKEISLPTYAFQEV